MKILFYYISFLFITQYLLSRLTENTTLCLTIIMGIVVMFFRNNSTIIFILQGQKTRPCPFNVNLQCTYSVEWFIFRTRRSVLQLCYFLYLRCCFLCLQCYFQKILQGGNPTKITQYCGKVMQFWFYCVTYCGKTYAGYTHILTQLG